MLGREKLASGLPGVGCVFGDQKLIGIAEQIDLITIEVTCIEFAEIQPRHTLQHRCQASVLLLDRIAQTIAGGVKISEQALDIDFRRVAIGR